MSASEMTSLDSSQEETDTRVILYSFNAQEQGYHFVRVRSSDTDIFFILLYYASKLKIHLLFDTGTGNKRRLIDVTHLSKEFTPNYCAALPVLHAYTRCDTTNSFRGIGKVKPLKLLQKKQSTKKFSDTLGSLGRLLMTSSSLLRNSHAQCSCTKTKEVDLLWYEMLVSRSGTPGKLLDSKKNIDLSALPPPRVCFQEHIRRVNYQVGIWKRAHCPKPEIPRASSCGSWMDDEQWKTGTPVAQGNSIARKFG